MLKKYLFISILCLSGYLSGQQLPLGNLYNSNEYLINAAEAAIDSVPVIFMSHRRQWVGIQGIGPVTSMLNGHTHVGENASVGFQLFNDQIHLRNQYYGMFTFSRKFMFTPKNGFALGLSAGYYQNSFNFDKSIVDDPTDDFIANNTKRGTSFENSASIMLILDHFKLGLEIPRVVEQSLNTKNPDLANTLKRHFMVYSRFHYDLNDRMYLEPSVLWKFSPEVIEQGQIEGNLDVYFDKKYSFGGGYRSQEAIILRATAMPNKRMSVAYSYEFFPGGFTKYTGGSHEIRIGFHFDPRKKKVPPLPPVPPAPRYEYKVLPTQESIILHLKESQPSLAATLETLTDRGDFVISTNEENKSYVVEIDSKKDYLDKRSFEFKTLAELREFTNKLKAGDPSLQGDLEAIIDNSDLVKFERDYQYTLLSKENEILLKIETKNPSLSADLKELLNEGGVELKYVPEGYALDIGDENNKRRFVFSNLDEMNQFMLQLKESNPGFNSDLLNSIDGNMKLLSFEDKSFVYKKLNKNDTILLNIGTRSPRLQSDLKMLTDNHGDILLSEDESGGFNMIIGEKMESKKYDFKTLGELNGFVQKLKLYDPTLKDDPMKVIDQNTYMQMFEDKNYVYRKLRESNELLLKLKTTDPTVTSNLKDLMEDRTDIIFSVDPYGRYVVELPGKDPSEEKKLLKFETLAQVNQFTNQVKSVGVDANMKEATDNMGIQTDSKEYTKEELKTLRAVLRFKVGTSELTDMSRKLMEEKLSIVKDKPFKKLIIAGYTCDLGGIELNKQLSKKRAQRIADYYIQQGIPADKIEVYGKGPEHPVVPNINEYNRQQNRRVEFEVYF